MTPLGSDGPAESQKYGGVQQDVKGISKGNVACIRSFLLGSVRGFSDPRSGVGSGIPSLRNVLVASLHT